MKQEKERLLAALKETEPGTEKYRILLEDLKVIEEMEKKNLVSPEVVLGIVGNILITLLVLNYEQLGVVGSKFNLFLKRN